jgi:hypothetical protein
MNKRLKEAGRMVAAVGLPPSLKEEAYVTKCYGYELPPNSVVGITIERHQIYKVTKKRIVEVDPRKDFKELVKKHPDTDLVTLLDEYINIFRTNHLMMIERAKQVQKHVESIKASTGSEVGVSE